MKFKINACDGIYKDCLDVRFTKKCDNNCYFCIEKTGIDSLGDTRVEKMIKNTIKLNKKTILILGGEPFLYPSLLLAYIEGIRNHVDNIFITTSLPKTIDIDNDAIIKILSMVDGLNVSLQHYNWLINNTAMNSSSYHNRLEILSRILLNQTFRPKVRVSINLINGYIDNKKTLLECIKVLKDMNCTKVKINELQNVLKEDFVSFEKIMGLKMQDPYLYGCQTDVSKYFKEKEMEIILKRSCFVVKDKHLAKVSFKDFIKVLFKCFQKRNGISVLYEDGTISDGWKGK